MGMVSLALGIIFALISVRTFYDGYFWSWHPVLLSLGYAVAMPLSFQLGRDTAKSSGDTKSFNLNLHATAGASSLLFLLSGVVVMMLNKVRKERAHFTSSHAIWATTSTIPMVFAALLGAYAKYGDLLGVSAKSKSSLKKLHRLLMIISYITGTVTFYLGLATVDRGVTTTVLQVLYVALSASVVGPPIVKGQLSLRGINEGHMLLGLVFGVGGPLLNYYGGGLLFDFLVK